MPPVPGRLFVGETIEPATHQRTGEAVALDPASLTTHGVIVGMTGSGKTGLGIVLIEEVLLAGIPALIIDPKGDLGNLLLTFPDLSPDAFAPWVETPAGQAPDPAAATEQADAWREGLAGWGIGPERIGELRAKADFTIYTPGSTAGVPLNLVGGLGATADPADAESSADQIESTVSGLLGLIGVESDPLSGREHILLANLLMAAHASGTRPDLASLIRQVQSPPFRTLGVLELDTFFPPSDRTALALKLNGLLASPAFSAWNQGEDIDIGALLTSADGRPRAAIVSIAHLGDEERQFVVSLLLSRLIGWMRQQPGTASLRALVYFDEVFGFAPPNGMPPAKKPILTLLKQARAFGVGMVLATQNPVDLDYKAISNAGTWMVGRLQTEQDKARLADGMTTAAGGDPQAISDSIAGLAKREFVLHRASSDEHPVFTSRWSMSFLRGPLTREQIASLTPRPAAAPETAAPETAAPPTTTAPPPATPLADAPAVSPAGAPPPTPAPTVSSSTPSALPAASTAAAVPVAADEVVVMPSVAADVRVVFLDPAAAWLPAVGAVPHRTRLAAAIGVTISIHYDEAALDLDFDERYEAILFPLTDPIDVAGLVAVDHDPRDFVSTMPAGARFVLPDVPLDRKAWFTGVRAAAVAELQRTKQIEVRRHQALKLVARPGETAEQFAARCDAAADAAANVEAEKIRAALVVKIDRVKDAVAKAQDRIDGLETAAKASKATEAVGMAGALLTNLLGGRRSVRGMAGDVRSAASRRGQSARASTRVDEAQNRLVEKVDDLAALEQELAATLVEIDDKWATVATEIDVVAVGVEKTDIRIDDLFVVWLPVA